MRMIRNKNNDREVNLDNLSRIVVDEENKKVIFNLNYTIRSTGRETSDYVYWFYETQDELSEIFETINNNIDDRFIEIPHSKSVYINLKNVSSIKFNRDNKKIIFNYNYSVLRFEDRGYVSDYDPFFCCDGDEFDSYEGLIREKISNWIFPFEENIPIINPEFVASFKVDRERLKFIINLSFSVSQPHKLDEFTSGFVAYRFRSQKLLDEFLEYIWNVDNFIE